MHNLKNEDKNQIRENLSSFMEKNPIKKNAFSRVINWKPTLPSLKLNLQFMPTKVIAIALMAALLLGGGATAFASEDSLPGDTLYTVKSATEHVRGWMKWSDQSRADWKATMAERKLEEIKRLYEEGEITEEKKLLLEGKVEEMLERANMHIEKMKAKGENHPAFNVTARLGRALAAHEKNLEKWEEKFADKAATHEKFAQKLGERADKFEAMRIKFEEKIVNQNGEVSKVAAERKLQAVEKIISAIADYIDETKETLGEEAVTGAEAKLQIARDFLAQGETKVDEEKYGEAFLLFHKAQGAAIEAKRLIAVQLNDCSDTATSTMMSKFKTRMKGKAFGLFKDKPEIDDGEVDEDDDDEESEE